MRTVIQLLHEGARLYGKSPYLGQKFNETFETFSFIQADLFSACFAAALVKRSFKKEDTAAILAEGQSAWVISEFGLLKAGCTAVPLSTKLSGDEIRFRLNHSQAKILLVSENNFARVAEVFPGLDKKPLLILLSPQSAKLSENLTSLELKEEEHFVFYEDLVREGAGLLGLKISKDQALQASTLSLQDIDSQNNYAKALLARETELREDDTVTICYTSGTTGNPKGIMLSHLNYWDNSHAAAEVVPIETGWKSLIMLPLDHSFAHTVGIYIFLMKGLCMYFVDARGGGIAAMRNLPKNLLEVNPDFLLTVPALSGNFMKKIIQGVAEKGPFINGIFQRGLKAGILRAGNGYNKTALSLRIKTFFPWFIANTLVFPKLRGIFGKDIKFCIGGGALLEIKQQEFFNALGVPVFQGYGLTENSPIICSNSARKYKFGTSGVIIPSLEVRIMKDDYTECALGEIGQIVTRGDSVMKGYFKNPEATTQTLRDGWLWSGDLGYKDPDGFLVVTGREKALLISMDGEKYSPETLEEAIVNTSRYVSQVMAYNEQCRFTSLLITINAELLKQDLDKARKNGSVLGEEEILSLLKADISAFAANPDYAHIPAQWRPASFALIPQEFSEDHGLINSTMKLVRHKVKDFYRDRLDEVYAQASPELRLEGNLLALKKLGLLE